MGVMDLNPAGAAKAITEAAGGGSELFKLITAATELGKAWSPLIQVIANRLPQNQNSGGSQILFSQPPAPANVNPPSPPPKQEVFDEKTLMNILNTPAGREQLAKGLEQVKSVGGDLTLSQMIEILRSGKPLVEEKK